MRSEQDQHSWQVRSNALPKVRHAIVFSQWEAYDALVLLMARSKLDVVQQDFSAVSYLLNCGRFSRTSWRDGTLVSFVWALRGCSNGYDIRADLQSRECLEAGIEDGQAELPSSTCTRTEKYMSIVLRVP
jgi:hypothetical protein